MICKNPAKLRCEVLAHSIEELRGTGQYWNFTKECDKLFGEHNYILIWKLDTRKGVVYGEGFKKESFSCMSDI